MTPQGDVEPTNNGDGTYSLRMSASKAGTWKLSVLIDGQPIKNSPFAVLVSFGLSTGAIIGIAFSLIFLVALVFFAFRRWRKKSKGRFTWERL